MPNKNFVDTFPILIQLFTIKPLVPMYGINLSFLSIVGHISTYCCKSKFIARCLSIYGTCIVEFA